MKKTTKSYVLGLLVILFLLPNVVFAQSLTVEGTVNDETGEPLIGATVKVRPGGTGAITDLNGHFLLPSVERGATLEISFMGYKTQTRKVDGKPITVSLLPDQKDLDEVVVIAYGHQKKMTLTGAVSAVSGEELLKAPVANVANALQGRLPGISVVQPSGMPGADEPVIRVRGTGH